MGVSYGRSRIADLVFQVFGRSIHPDWFSVREYLRVSREGWEADIRVIEGGHAVIFRSGQTRLTEVLSGPETLLPEPGLLFHSTVRNERSTNLRPCSSIEYQTCFEVERVEPEVFAHLSEEMALDASGPRLFHRFAPVNRMAPAPVSHIHFEARVRGLSIHSFHTFPEERAVLRTQSLFEPK
ncbi:MAG: hypothetical protein NVSMB9_08940 [Isosphaeraceae bacterium]